MLVISLTRASHLVIYGSSKQGKTSLRKHALKQDDYITVHCSNKWQLGELHGAILKMCGYEITQSTTRGISGKVKTIARIKGTIFGAGAEAESLLEGVKNRSKTTAPLELDSDDVNDIIKALNEIDFQRYIVLEDFHYLPVETPKDFAVALKAFHENSEYCFIVIGVWLEENRLTVYNGDLTGRVISINADKWEHAELRGVIEDVRHF